VGDQVGDFLAQFRQGSVCVRSPARHSVLKNEERTFRRALFLSRLLLSL
jgi:hypothetical protein